MKKCFGTDGGRGVTNLDLTPELALRLGRAAGRALPGDTRRVVIGRDTRRSGPTLETALVAGMVLDLKTPFSAIAGLCRSTRRCC